MPLAIVVIAILIVFMVVFKLISIAIKDDKFHKDFEEALKQYQEGNKKPMEDLADRANKGLV